MNTLNDLRAYARTVGMSEGRIERLISEVETDENGNVLHYDDIVFGINCEMDDVIRNNQDWCNNKPMTIKAKYIANVTKELDGEFFSGTEMRIKRITCFVQKNETTGEEFNEMLKVAFLHQAKDESLIGVEVITE